MEIKWCLNLYFVSFKPSVIFYVLCILFWRLKFYYIFLVYWAQLLSKMPIMPHTIPLLDACIMWYMTHFVLLQDALIILYKPHVYSAKGRLLFHICFSSETHTVRQWTPFCRPYIFSIKSCVFAIYLTLPWELSWCTYYNKCRKLIHKLFELFRRRLELFTNTWHLRLVTS